MSDQNQNQQQAFQAPKGFSVNVGGFLISYLEAHPEVMQAVVQQLLEWIMTAITHAVQQQTQQLKANAPMRLAGDESLRQQGQDASTADQPQQIKAG